MTDSLIFFTIFFISLILFYKYLTSSMFSNKEKQELIKKILLNFVYEAEKRFGEKTGSIKFGYVMEKFYTTMPNRIKNYISLEQLEFLIENALKEFKLYLENKEEL